jgi:hypothetical protein
MRGILRIIQRERLLQQELDLRHSERKAFTIRRKDEPFNREGNQTYGITGIFVTQSSTTQPLS